MASWVTPCLQVTLCHNNVRKIYIRQKTLQTALQAIQIVPIAHTEGTYCYPEGKNYHPEGRKYHPEGRKYHPEGKMTASAYYIDVPLNLSLKGSLAPGYALTAHIGPYIGFGLSGDFEYEDEYKSNSHYDDSYSDNNNIKLFEKDIKNDFILVNRFNMGIGFGVGLEISDFYIGANYNYGLTSLTTDEAVEKSYIRKIYERTLGISLGYGF
jgi:hypothetical protein